MEGDEPLVKAFNGQWFILPSAAFKAAVTFLFLQLLTFLSSLKRKEEEGEEVEREGDPDRREASSQPS
jgi:hypothetical protein